MKTRSASVAEMSTTVVVNEFVRLNTRALLFLHVYTFSIIVVLTDITKAIRPKLLGLECIIEHYM